MDINPYESPRGVTEPVEAVQPDPNAPWWLESLSLFAVVALLASIATPVIFSNYFGWF